MNTRAFAGHHPPPAPSLARFAAAPIVGVVLGITLGWWCGKFADSRSAMGVLADLGAPWIAAAFVAGAVVVLRPPHDMRLRNAWFSSAVAGAAAGAICLVVATLVYYGPARTGTFSFGDRHRATLAWSVIGVGVGAVYGAVGAVWRSATGPGIRTACLSLVGVATTAEALFLLQFADHNPTRQQVLLVIAVTGAAYPLLAGLRWHAVAGVFGVPLIAGPTAAMAAAFARAVYDAIIRSRM